MFHGFKGLPCCYLAKAPLLHCPSATLPLGYIAPLLQVLSPRDNLMVEESCPAARAAKQKMIEQQAMFFKNEQGQNGCFQQIKHLSMFSLFSGLELKAVPKRSLKVTYLVQL